MAHSKWEDDHIQFPRLIAEIIATQENLDVVALCEAMDISIEELDSLFERAQAAWARLSYNTKNETP